METCFNFKLFLHLVYLKFTLFHDIFYPTYTVSSIKTISLKVIFQENLEIIKNWTSSTFKSDEISSSKIFGICQNLKKITLFCWLSRQHLHKRSTKFSLRQTNKWFKKSYVLCLCREGSWILLKTNVHWKQYLNSWDRKKVLQLIRFLFFVFCIHIFLCFLNGNI